ncbi:MAG: hypothetical protein PHQ03_04425 [Methylococcales bacterium]|nr:hypothetical protein [Methylococcales bacterium]
MSDFPEYYPEKCPPSQAKDVEGEIFRFTTRNTPHHRDFLSHYELGIGEGCQAMGLSVFLSIEACEEMKDKVPAMRKKKIASADLNSKHGRFAHTPSTNSKRHMTWWVSSNLKEPWTLFSNVDN